MAKSKTDFSKLTLPGKPAVVKKGGDEHLLERAVGTIHKPQEETEPERVKKISLDLPLDHYRFVKHLCFDRAITMREYILGLIGEEMRKNKNGFK